MILSYHPYIVADRNLRCAGRQPDAADAAAMAAADAVILNQGCYESLYRMAATQCSLVFPNYDARFGFPGKIGQIHLFQHHGVLHPPTETYAGLDAYQSRTVTEQSYPAVFKFDWGGEGETVFFVENDADMAQCLTRAQAFEGSGQHGFLVQDYISHGGRTLRVVVIHQRLIAYWRIQDNKDRFGTSVATGARIDREADPERREKAIHRVKDVCKDTGINLAGVDLLYSEEDAHAEPYFLEINYFFGRRGLGGSESYYQMLGTAVTEWLASNGLAVRND